MIRKKEEFGEDGGRRDDSAAIRSAFGGEAGREEQGTLASALVLRIRGAAKKERWGRALLQIAWTAGPVTYMALQGGYLIGYGETAPNSVVVYFAMYTVIAGAFALVVRFLYAMTRGLDQDEGRLTLSQVFESLPERLLEIRDLQMRSLGDGGRRVLGAKYILEDPEADPDAVAAAFMELTDDRDISRMAREVEVYRRCGLGIRLEERAEELKRALEPHLPDLGARSAEIVRLAERRIGGGGGGARSRRCRTKGFIERILLAHEADNLDLMSLVDAEEVCILVFELICGRRFPLFRTEYTGEGSFTESARKLAAARREYRSAVSRRNNRIRVLAEMLYEEKPAKRRGQSKRSRDRSVIRRVISSLPSIRTARILQDKIVEALEGRLAAESVPSKPLKRILVVYERLRADCRQVERRYAAFRKAWEGYARILSGMGKDPVRLLRQGESGRGVRIATREVRLKPNQVLPLAGEINERLSEFTLEHEHADVKANDQKELAVSMLRTFERYFDLDDPIVRRSIESTRSISPANLSRAVSPMADENAWLDRISDNRQSMRSGIHETVKSLVDGFRLSLRPDDIEYLANRFHADPEFLVGLIPEGNGAGPEPFGIPEPAPAPPSQKELLGAVRKQGNG